MGFHIKVFIAVYLLFWISVYCVYSALPDQMASHFDAHGQADGWTTRFDFLKLIGGVGIGLPCLIYIPIALLPVSMMNVPNKAYWSTPERSVELKTRLKKSMLEMIIIIIGFLTGIDFLVIYANQTSPPQLPIVPLFILLVLFILSIALQTTAMFRRLRVS